MNKKLRKILDRERDEPVAHMCHVGRLENKGVECDRCEQEAELAVEAHLADPDGRFGGRDKFDQEMYLCLSCTMALIALGLDIGIVGE